MDENEQTAASQTTPTNEEPASTPVDLVGDLVENMPDVQPHVIEAAEREQAQLAEKANSVQSRNGEKFNAAIHATNPDGSPRLTAGGTFAKKRGRKQGGTNVASGPFTAPGPNQQVVAQAQLDAQARASGIAIAQMFFGSCTAIFGDEWAPVKTKEFDEADFVEKATADYCQRAGVKDVPPWAVLGIAYGSYILRRFQMPKTQSKLQKAKEWVFVKYAQWKARKEPKLDAQKRAEA